MLNKIFREIKNSFIYSIRYFIVLMFNKKIENKIIFATTRGSYSCNPKWICEEVIKRKIPYKLVWATDKKYISNKELKSEFPKEVKLVERGSIDYYKEALTSKILIDNENNFGRRYKYKKRKGQIYFQTWHGSMGLKRICLDRGLISRVLMNKTKKYQSYVDYVISNSEFEDGIFRSTYWPKTEILKYGHARNDILFKNDKEIINKVKKYYDIDKDTKILLYAPTFRENKSEYEEIDFNKLKKCLEETFNSKWVIMVRVHEKDLMNDKYKNNKDIINTSLYPDIQELMIASDVGITDYSSWICDYILTRKMSFLYAPDIEEYKSGDRGFYYSLDDVPFKVCKNMNELIKNIKDFDDNKYQKSIDKFLKERNCYEKGNASKKIVDKIMEVTK